MKTIRAKLLEIVNNHTDLLPIRCTRIIMDIHVICYMKNCLNSFTRSSTIEDYIVLNVIPFTFFLLTIYVFSKKWMFWNYVYFFHERVYLLKWHSFFVNMNKKNLYLFSCFSVFWVFLPINVLDRIDRENVHRLSPNSFWKPRT